jgi:hypothetical protein
MSGGDDLQRRIVQLEAMTRDVFVGTVVALHGSIQTGSAVTAAPGQPVDTGNLRNSWLYEFDTPMTATISTNVEYAEAVEDGVALTIAGAQKIADVEVMRVASQDGK